MVRKKAGKAAAMTDAEQTAVDQVEGDEAAGDSESEGTKARRLTLRALSESVATATGAKKKAARDIVAATVAEIAAALERGEELVLPPLGRLRLTASRDSRRGTVAKLRLVRTPAADTATEGLAEAAE